jgi:hypothetical protein
MFAYLSGRRSRKIDESLVTQAAGDRGKKMSSRTRYFLRGRRHRVIGLSMLVKSDSAQKVIPIYHRVHGCKDFLRR